MNELFLWRRGIRRPRIAASFEPEAKLPQRLVIPLEPADSTYGHALRVEAGEEILRHRLIGLGLGLAPSLHSPAAGTVESVEEKLLRPDGTFTRGIAIDVSGDRALEPKAVPLAETLPAQQILERIGDAGVALRGPRAISLRAAIEASRHPQGFLGATGGSVSRSLSHIVVRLADVDPSLASVSAAASLAEKKPDDLMLGLRLLTRATGASRITLVLHKGQKLPNVEGLAEELELGLLRVSAHRYPELAGPLVAAKASGIEPPVGIGPLYTSGVLVTDVDTVLEVVEAVRDGLPSVRPFVTISTSMEKTVRRVAIGTPLRAVIGAGARAEARKIALGGLMAGIAAPDFDQPVVKETDGVCVLPGKDVLCSQNLPCMGCGACARACPMRLVPSLLSRAAEFDQLDTARSLDIFHCIDCGVCGFVCPAGRSMVQLITAAKTALVPRGRV